MAQHKNKLRNLAYNIKDKASVIVATLSIKRHVSSVRVRVLRATTHALTGPPSEDRIAAVLAVASSNNTSHLLPRVCIDALMDRLHRTGSATVALKCLFTLHNVVVKGPFTLKDQLAYYPSYGGHNFLNLSTFRDDSDLESLQLSDWVRWYAGVIEQSLTVSRILGYYLRYSSSSSSNTIQETNSLTLGTSNADLLYKIEALVAFLEQLGKVPESLQLQKKELVYEVVKLVGEDYRSVQREIVMRLEEMEGRMENLDVGEVSELVGYVKRMEECKEKLVMLFVNKGRNGGFWDLVRETKERGLKIKGEIEGKWLTVVVASKTAADSTRFNTNPFLEPGQTSPVPLTSFAFATVR
ncbi:hypothetical protein HN51_018531 [Arachis hypogaea]|uniref:ENTH domain-containing protein n=1 Tax=Arachis hypogaea TaxID=3818 RepID=A0A445BTI4_ARAHY|nr:putative clathrin assembly protein At4g40080 [Arachis hypogaea]QHO30128.1 Putative clathrin assembly protein [Arachis hypogaea]RYR42024.1 hypothetical protein Ahy_A08g038473 [Arachis hypogaea]